MAKKQIEIRPGKGASVMGMVIGVLFVLIGLFAVIPSAGMFGVFWTLMALAITIVNGVNAFSQRGIATHRVVVEEEEQAPAVFPVSWAPSGPSAPAEDRLRQLQSLLDQGLITREEYQQRRTEILREI